MAQSFETAYLYDTKKANPTAWSELFKATGEKRWGGRRRQGHKGNNRISRLTPAQVEEYKKAGKCFQCGQTGHMARKCPRRGERLREIGNAAAAIEDNNVPVEEARQAIAQLDTHE